MNGNKMISPEKAAKIKEKEARELERLRREQAKPKGNFYLIYFVILITVIYLADEVTTQIGTQMQSIVASEIFAPVFGAEVAVSRMSTFGLVGTVIGIFAFIYKPLSDRFGRRIFLVINTLGMGIGMLLVSIATNIPVYLLGSWVIAFFIPHDMQAVYIYESAPAKHRAKIYSIVKGLATMGMFLIPFLRGIFIPDTDQSGWRFVYMVPALITLVIAMIALFCIRESDAFLEARIRQLTMSEEEKEAAKAKNQDVEARGGLGKALKFIAHHKQVRWLCIAYGFILFGMVITMFYETIMTTGFSQSFLAAGASAEEARLQATSLVTAALMIFPFASAFIQMVQGFFSDTLGRKKALMIMSAVCAGAYLLFYFGAIAAWSPYLVGAMAGIMVGSYWAAGDINGMMISESAPTNLRVSIMTIQPLVGLVVFLVPLIIFVVLMNLMGDAMIGVLCLCFAVVGLVIALLIVGTKTKETKGCDMGAVQGDEFEQEHLIN